MNARSVDKFISDQLSVWPGASASYRRLKDVELRNLELGGLKVRLQHNPARICSTAARTDAASVSARPCFLCASNRPEEQMAMRFEGRKGRLYHILLNPYPIFPSHLVIASGQHEPQSIRHRLVDMMDLAHHYPGFSIFYNGPRCGASAPDHMHFQACPRRSMPLECEADRLLDAVAHGSGSYVPRGEESAEVPQGIRDRLEYVCSVQEAQLFHYLKYAGGVFFLRARTSKSMAKLFYRLLDCASCPPGEDEPMFNLICWYSPTGDACTRPAGNTHGTAPFEYRAVVMFRQAHRPRRFFAQGAGHIGISPGCADMAGLFIVPDPDDFHKLDALILREIVDEVALSREAERELLRKLTRTQPLLQVGIMSGSEICFEIISDGAGMQRVSYREGKVDYCGALYDELRFDASTMSTMFAEPSFILYGVTIGIDFHWEQKQVQKFAGSLRFVAREGKVLAINEIGVEDYLLSVISSEMKASASLEFLKAHAVISRSWVMSRILGRRKKGVQVPQLSECSLPALVTELESRRTPQEQSGTEGDTVVVERWFDHEDHRDFDVCADDHCQRYQGLGMAVGENVRKAVDATWGQLLRYGSDICDARFSKCCGGRTELFSSCWEDGDKPYLPSLPDTPGHQEGGRVWCDCSDEKILSQVLNGYDLQTRDFYRWTETRSRDSLSALISRRSGVDIGRLKEIRVLQRGPSGRIIRMEAVGSLKTLRVGKELMVRRVLSESHLRSSAFDLRVDGDEFMFSGRGWGHGVGLCQIGAAVMASEGHGYREILSHYYPGSEISDNSDR